MTEALFELPEDAYLIPPPEEHLTRGQRRQRLVAERIACGVHPLGRPVLLHAAASCDPEDRETGPRCGTCVFRVLVEGNNRTYPKCRYGEGHPRDTHCESSDIRKWWPACRQYQEDEV